MLLANPNQRRNGFLDFISSYFFYMLWPRRIWRHSRGQRRERKKEESSIHNQASHHLLWQAIFTWPENGSSDSRNYHFDPKNHRKSVLMTPFFIVFSFLKPPKQRTHQNVCAICSGQDLLKCWITWSGTINVEWSANTSRKRAKWKMCVTLDFRSVRPVLTYLAELLYIFICRISSVKCKCSVRMVLTFKRGLPRFTCHQT